MESIDLVYIDEYGLLGCNFYWHRHDAKGITKQEILAVGLNSDRVQIHRSIVDPLVEIDKQLQESGLRLYIKEGYRSRALYQLVYRKRVEKFGQEETDKLFNMTAMPHSTGKSVDATFWCMEKDKEVYLRRGIDGTDALFVDFYKGSEHPDDQDYQRLQEGLINLMQHQGFRLGTKREYFHFDYKPDSPKNY